MKKDFEYASYTRRCFSNIIDIAILGFLFTFLFIFGKDFFDLIDKVISYGSLIFFLVSLLLYHTYFTYSKWQATPGKIVFKIKIIDASNKKLDIKTSFVRSLLALLFYLFFIGIFTIPLIYLEYFSMKLGFLHSYYIRSLFYNASLPIYLLIDLSLMYGFFYIFNKHQTIYDRLTNTQVIIQKSRGKKNG